MSSNNSNEYLEICKKAFTQFSINKVIDKYKQIINYKTFWPAAKAETSSIKSIYQDYLIVLTLIGPISTFIALSRNLPAGMDIPIVSFLSKILVGYFISLAYYYIFALAIEKITPYFNGSCTKENAFKLIVYSMFPMLLAGLLVIAKILILILGLLAASLYLLWLGVPIMLNVPEEKRTQAAITIMAVGLMIMMVISLIIS